MKRKIILLSSIIVVFIIAYFMADTGLFIYGMSNYNVCKKELPMNLTPDYWDSDVSFPIVGFTIKDEYGIVLFGKGDLIRFKTDTITVNSILRYGYDDDTLIVVFKDLSNNYFSAEYFKGGKNNKSINHIINGLHKNHLMDKKDFLWVDVNDSTKISCLKITRTYSGLLIILSFLIMLFQLTRNKKL